MNDNKNFENINNIILKVVKDLDGDEAFLIGNVIKYISRYDEKNGVEDLRKAKWYLNELIELLKEKGKLYNSDLPTRAKGKRIINGELLRDYKRLLEIIAAPQEPDFSEVEDLANRYRFYFDERGRVRQLKEKNI